MRSRHLLIAATTITAVLLGISKTARVGASVALPRDIVRWGTVAYVQNGDIYTKDLPDGSPRRITWGGHHKQPRWSPSGRWISYVRSQEAPDKSFHSFVLTVTRRDGTKTRTLPGRSYIQKDFAWSPLSDDVATIGEDGALVVTHPGTGKTQTLVAGEQGTEVASVSWSPDGRWLAYTTRGYGPESNALRDHFRGDLWRVRAADGKLRRHLFRSSGHELVPDLTKWSADSRFVFFWTLNTYPGGSVNLDGMPLYVVSIDRGKARLLFDDEYKDFVLDDPGFLTVTAHHPFAVVSAGGDRWHISNKQLASLDPRTGAVRRLTPPTLAATYPAWSPDGRRLAFIGAPNVDPDSSNSRASSWESSRKQTRVWVMNAQNTRERRRLNGDHINAEAAPRWLADSEHVVFERALNDRANSLWMMRADGSDLRCVAARLDNGGYDSEDDHFDIWLPTR